MKARAMLKKEKEKQGRNTRDTQQLVVELAIGVLAEEHLSDCW